MKKTSLLPLAVFLIVIIIVAFAACTKDPANAPVTITSVNSFSPLHGLPGSRDTITGTNFNVDPTKDTVFFNGLPVTIDSASSTEIIVTIPFLTDTANISVSVHDEGKLTFSQSFRFDTIVAVFYEPYQLTIDSNNNLYATCLGPYQNRAIFKISSAGALSTYTNGYPYTLLQNPEGLAFDKNTGDLYAAGLDNDSIYKIDNSGTVASIAKLSTTGPANFYYLATNGNGNIYAVHKYGDSVLQITTTGQVTTFATVNSLIAGNSAITVDSSGNIYIANYGAGNIIKILPSGVSSVFASGFSSIITGITTDKNGALYITTDAGSSLLVEKIDTAATVSPIATLPTGTIYYGITVDKNDNIYVADFINNAILKVTQAGTVSTFYH
jgi:hypothetical protein